MSYEVNMAKRINDSGVSLANYVPPAKLLVEVGSLTLDKINFKFAIGDIHHLPKDSPASERWIIVDDNATGKETFKKNTECHRTTSFAAKYFSEDSIPGSPLSMIFRKESVPEVLPKPNTAPSSSRTGRSLNDPTKSMDI